MAFKMKGWSGFTNEISDITKNITKKHNLIDSKNLSIKGQVSLPKVNLNWDGGPKLNIKNKANISGTYKLSPNTTLSGGVEFETGSKPYYTGGLTINL
jgi:hypothetical protein